MTKFILIQNKVLNKSLLIAQNEDGSPIEPLLSNFMKHIKLDNLTPLEVIAILKWTMSHQVSVKTNTLILNSLLLKLDEEQIQDTALMAELLKLHNDYQDSCLDMWKHKIETDFNPYYWLIAVQCLPTKISSMKTWLMPINKIKFHQYKPSGRLPQWYPNIECWLLMENTLPPLIFKNLVTFIFYSSITNVYQKKNCENYAIGYACSKILSNLPQSKTCKDLITTLIKGCPSKFKGKTLSVEGIKAIELLSNEKPIWTQQYGSVILNTFLELAIKEDLPTSMDGNHIDRLLQNLLELNTVPFESTTTWWDARFKNNLDVETGGIKMNPTKWNIPETDKIKWIQKLLKPALEKQDGLQILNTLLGYTNTFPPLATACFDLMSEKQWQDCKNEWFFGTAKSLRAQLKWLHVDHPRINEWKESKIGKRNLCAALLHYITEFKITQETGVKDWNGIQPLIEYPAHYFSDNETISILPAPFNALEAWLPKYMELYKKLSVDLLIANEEHININKLITVVSSFCNMLLEDDINANALINLRDSIDTRMDFISLFPPLQKREELYELPKFTFDNTK